MTRKPTTARTGNLSKEQLANATKEMARVTRAKKMARDVFPLLEGLKSVYDAQTVVNAAAGHVLYGIQKAEAQLTVKDLEMELGKGKTDVDQAVHQIIAALADCSAREASDILDAMGRKFPEYLAYKHLKDPMDIKVDDFIA